MPRGNRFKKVAGISGKATNKKLKEELARITTLDEERLNKLLPNKGDKQRFAELMSIVNDASAMNTKVAKLGQNIQKLGPVVMKVLKAVV